MAWMNRVLHPVYKISETHIGQDFMVPGVEFEEVDSPFFKKKFVALKDKYKDMKRKNRVLAIVEDTDEYSYELKRFKLACESLSYRKDLRCAQVTEPAAVNALWEEHKFDWFEEGGRNTIVMARDDGSIAIYDVESEQTDLITWLQQSSVKPLEFLDEDTEKIVLGNSKKPVFLVFVKYWANKHSDEEVAATTVFLDWL